MCFLLPTVPCVLILGYFKAIIIAQWAQKKARYHKVKESVIYWWQKFRSDHTYLVLGLFYSSAAVSGFLDYQ
jgi:hypothetical protein